MSKTYATFFYRMEEMINTQYQISSTIKHIGEKGRQREDGLAQFLKDNLPEKYGVGTGEIISADTAEPSPQCDIIIYDKLNMPIIGKQAAVQQIPIEAVYAVIEVKSNLDQASLFDAERKFAQIREMPRCDSSTLLEEDYVRGPKFYLFGYKLKTSTEKCNSFMQRISKGDDASIIALDTGATVWIDNEDGSARSVFLITTAERDEQPNMHYTLGLFFTDLLSSLEEIDLGRVNFMDLLKPLKYRIDELLGA